MDFDDLVAPTGSIFKYKTELSVGESVQGVLLAKPEVVPDTDFVTKEHKKSSKGNLLWQLKVQLQIGDDAKTLFLSSSAYFSAVDAFREAASKEYRGGVFGIKRVDDTPSKTAGFASRKNFQVKFVPPQSGE
jgi:hypothetical protein